MEVYYWFFLTRSAVDRRLKSLQNMSTNMSVAAAGANDRVSIQHTRSIGGGGDLRAAKDVRARNQGR